MLQDKSALGYFVQYLESRNVLPYIRCWLDVENFRAAVELIESARQNVFSPIPGTKIEHDSLSVSTDCDSCTADSTSLYDSSIMLSDKIDVKQNDNRKLDSSPSCDKNSDISSKICREEEKSVQNYLEEFMEDALLIFKKYIALEATDPVSCPEDVRNEIVEGICGSSWVSSACFDKVQKHVHDILDKEYFEAFLGSNYFCKHQIDVLTSGSVALDDILCNETALFYFMEFLEQENHRYLLDFWLAATNFYQQMYTQKELFDSVEMQNDAIILYDRYISLQAHCPLGVSDKVRFIIEQNICGDNGSVIDCFQLPLRIVERVLEKHFLRPFLASQLFYKYLSELINAVQSNGYPSVFDGNSISDCSSEKSFSTNSTFLAMENPNKSIKKAKTDMSIDTRHLYDPDSLWRRRKHHRLSLGRVTELGRFEPDFEPEPDKKNGSKLKNVMRKFVNMDEDGTKEEMAWQVAEMIVKDITNITLNDQKF